MLCKTCGYSLWGLAARACPECGTAFRPSESAFVPHSVQFCCPHCRQPYYGTSEIGHLVPPEFDCVSCGRHIHMDEMVLLPGQGVAEDQTRVQGMPWLERKDRGLVRAWFATIGMAMIRPGRLIALTPVQSSTGAALGFAWLCMIVFFLSYSILVPFGLAYFLISGTGGPWFGSIAGVIGIIYLTALGVLGVGLMVWPLVTHAVLRATGGTAAGLGRTFQAMSYSSAANVVLAVPCIGLHLLLSIGWIWWAVSSILMIRTGQRVHGGRATLAVLSFPIALMVLIIASVWLAERSNPVVTTIFPPTSTSLPATPEQNEEAGKLARALLDYNRQHEGAYPTHALGLIAAGLASPSDFVTTTFMGEMTEVRIGRMSLDELAVLSEKQQDSVARTFASQLPRDVVAHRLGDFIFTYHGIDPDEMDEGLWVVVLAPRQGLAAADMLDETYPGMEGQFSLDGIVAGVLDGTIVHISTDRVTEKLDQQNRLRSDYGLAPLPDPRAVTATQPARGAEGGSEQSTGRGRELAE